MSHKCGGCRHHQPDKAEEPSGYLIFGAFALLAVLVALLFSGCATTNPVKEQREGVLECVKELKSYDFEPDTAFEICRQVYRMRKVKDL